MSYGMMATKRDCNGLKAEQFPSVYDVAKDAAEGAFSNLGAALRSHLNRLRRLSRSLSRRTQGSTRWWKAKRTLVRFHKKVTDKRADVQHQMTTAIAKTYHTVGVEDLHVKGMVRNDKLALSIADTGMGEVLRQLAYKAEQ